MTEPLMTDAALARYTPPPLRISATYAASDGRVPEEIIIELGGGHDGQVDPELIDVAVNALARVAAVRDAGMHGRYRVTADALDAAADRAAAQGGLVDLEAVAADVERRAHQKAGAGR